MSRWLDKAAVLGKAPWRAEFLRASGRSSELRSFDEWLFQNGSALTDSPREPGHVSHGFVLCLAPADHPLQGIAGVLGPSCDSAGRSYPLSVAAPVAFDAEAGAHPEVAPIVLESYWDFAIDVLTAARSGPPAAGAGALDELTERPAESSAGALGHVRRLAQTNDGR